jgi:hypothetical protein
VDLPSGQSGGRKNVGGKITREGRKGLRESTEQRAGNVNKSRAK